jgi:hypothetical protein
VARQAGAALFSARKIAENSTGFFAVLAEWARAEMMAPAKDGRRAEFETGAVSATASHASERQVQSRIEGLPWK